MDCSIKFAICIFKITIIYFVQIEVVLMVIIKHIYYRLYVNIFIYSLRKYSADERLQIIEFAIYHHKDYSLAVCDGIKDLITDINSMEQSDMLTCKLLKWTEEKSIHICCVLHLNKKDGNGRSDLDVNKSDVINQKTRDQSYGHQPALVFIVKVFYFLIMRPKSKNPTHMKSPKTAAKAILQIINLS